ncbi:MAG: hypothetical protein ACFFCS_23955 [Candidatus Hodarchaeota archaeon]
MKKKPASKFLLGSLLILVISFTMLPAGKAATTWPSWIPSPSLLDDWIVPPGGNFSSMTENILINPEFGATDDIPLYSQLLVDPSNNTLIVNYMDFEETSGVPFTGYIFDLEVPAAYRTALNEELAHYTQIPFQGTRVWDLIEFVFLNVWNEVITGTFVEVSTLQISERRSILLDYEGYGGLGLVSFTDLGNKACIIFNFEQNSPWINVDTFNSTIQSFFTQYFTPLKEILHVAHFDPYEISSSSISEADSIKPVNASLYLTQDDFLSIASTIVGNIPVPEFPYELSINEIIIVIMLGMAIFLVIYYSTTAYAKRKDQIPE